MERQFTEPNFQIVIKSTFNLLISSLAHGSTLKTFLYVFLEKNPGGTLNYFRYALKDIKTENKNTIIPSPERAPIKI